MKKVTFLILFIFLTALNSCGQNKINTPKTAMSKFEEFILKEKFLPDSKIFYPGIGDEKLKPILTELINESAKDFQNVAIKGIASDKEYQNVIEKGLDRFSKIYLKLDTENRERICTYYEELMDIVGLESSGGLLNEFIYGFDFSE
jgi:hypothetical protein